jgi:hypothetical protein
MLLATDCATHLISSLQLAWRGAAALLKVGRRGAGAVLRAMAIAVGLPSLKSAEPTDLAPFSAISHP